MRYQALKKKMTAIYDQAASKHGISSRAVLLDDPQKQYLRFAELIKYIDLGDAKKTVLDIGCGNGELYKFLNFMGFRGSYVGVDINQKLLSQARGRFKGACFKKKDIMLEPIGGRYDYVLISGLFNTNIGQTDTWVFDFLKKAFALCKDCMVFNMISSHVNYKEKTLYYMSPSKVLDYCVDHLSRRATLDHHSLPYNFTMAVFAHQDWTSIGGNYDG